MTSDGCWRPALLLALPLALVTGTGDEPARSVIAPLAPESLLLDIAAVDGLLIAVGERGHVLLSRDQGASWRQVPVPTRATLTGVYFLDAERGWVVGHDAVILRTEDGGESWERVYSDAQAYRPLLDVWFRDAARGYAVGAYGYFLASDDGGRTWQQRELAAPRLAAAGGVSSAGQADEAGEDWYALEEYDFSQGITVHLNKIAAAADGRLFMAAETGAIFRSDDGGESWVSLTSPYDGSFFGLLPLEGESLLVFGLRGHLFRSDDAGASWRALDSGSEAMLTDGVILPGGGIVLTGLAGTLLASGDGGASFVLHQQANRTGLQAVVGGATGEIIAVGEEGVRRLEAPAGGVRP